MYLKKGSYTHETNEVSVSLSRDMEFFNGIASRVTEVWQLAGRTHGADQATLNTNLAALEAAYLIQGENLIFYFDDNSASQHSLLSSQCYGGTRVTRPISYPEGRGAQFTTYRDWTATVEGTKNINNINLIEFSEVLDFIGGGRRVGFLQPIEGLAQKQTLSQATTYKATQQGSAVGLRSYPIIPSPVFPFDEHIDRRVIRRETPARFGPPGRAVYTEFRISWAYQFESVYPFPPIAPNLWPI